MRADFMMLTMLLVGCAGRSAQEETPRSLVINSDIMDLSPGEEALFCTVTDVVLDAPFNVQHVHGYQSHGGHHAALFYTTDSVAPEGTHRCREQETTRWQLIGAGAEGEEVGLRLPPGIAVRIPRGARIVIESHYVNATTTKMRVRDRVTADAFADPSAIVGFAGTFQVTDFELAIPPHVHAERTIECALDGDLDVIDLNGHAHEWAERVTVSLARGGSDEFTTLYDRAWQPAFQFHPPTIDYDAPLRLRRSDRVRVTCAWNNTTDRTLTFPSEMCIATMHYLPDRGYLRCGALAFATP